MRPSTRRKLRKHAGGMSKKSYLMKKKLLKIPKTLKGNVREMDLSNSGKSYGWNRPFEDTKTDSSSDLEVDYSTPTTTSTPKVNPNSSTPRGEQSLQMRKQDEKNGEEDPFLSGLLHESETEDDSESDADMPTFMAVGYNNSVIEDGNQSNNTSMNASVNQAQGRVIENKFPPGLLFNGDEVKDEKKIMTFSSHEMGSIVVVLEHPMSIVIHGKALIRVVSGSVDVLGYTIDTKFKDFHSIFSSYQLGSLKIKTKVPDWKCVSHWKSLRTALWDYVSAEQMEELLSSCGDSSVVILLRQHKWARAVDFACTYFPRVLGVAEKAAEMFKIRGFTIAHEDSRAIEMTKQHQIAADKIDFLIRTHALNELGGPCIFVYGKRGFGKSTSLRYFINRTLSNWPKVCYLDVDPGQSEFAPAGCVSLAEITKPLLGPPFTHLKRHAKLAFYGNVSIDIVEQYCACIKKMAELYQSRYSDQPLFVNTCGWTTGIGKDCLDYIRKLLSPKMEVEIVLKTANVSSVNANTSIGGGINQTDETVSLKIPCCRPDLKQEIDAPSRRALSILSYFGQCLDHFSVIKPFNSLKPVAVCAEKIALHSIHPVYEKLHIEALNASFVALCIVDESEILVCLDDEREPKRLVPGADFSHCVGFGFVRALDVVKNIIYIVTPVKHEKLQKVNALVKGNVYIPDVLLHKQFQETFEQPPLYVQQIIGKKGPFNRKIKRQTQHDTTDCF